MSHPRRAGRPSSLGAIGACAFALLAGCSGDPFQRMLSQPKVLPYGKSDAFPDRRGMRLPPEGTIPREWRKGADLDVWRTARGYVEEFPIPLTEQTFERGRSRFEVYCATCHGLVGDGNSLVARNMSLRPPPSLHGYADRPVGFFYEVIRSGYGLMPSYASALSPEDRWATIAYVRALQRSQRVDLRSLPEAVRRSLEAGR